MNTIREIVKKRLCTGCGTCAGICPYGAIEMVKDKKRGVYFPKINEKKCHHCGLCLKACPGISVNFKQLNLSIFGKESKDILIGNYLNCYIGHSTDYDIRYNSASGGLITQLLIFALEEGIIDGALVTRMKRDKPLEPEPFIARTKEEIIEASKSKYCPVPANITLKKILESKEGKKFAVVGLPCHIHGIRKAEQINEKLKERIVLHIGIFCGHTPSFRATEWWFQKKGIKKEEVKKIEYRGNGWFGGISIMLKNGNIYFFDYFDYFDRGFGLYFFSTRCTLCCDGINELADISFGDPWLPEFKNDEVGSSVIISRTKIGDEILKKCSIKGELELSKIYAQKVVESQKTMLDFKKKSFCARISFFKLFNKTIPKYSSNLLKPSIKDYLNSILFYLSQWISSKRQWWLLDIYTSSNKGLIRLISYVKHKLKIR